MNEILKKLFEFLLPYVVEFIRKLIEDYLGKTPLGYEKQKQFLDLMHEVSMKAKDGKKSQRLGAAVRKAKVQREVSEFRANR